MHYKLRLINSDHPHLTNEWTLSPGDSFSINDQTFYVEQNDRGLFTTDKKAEQVQAANTPVQPEANKEKTTEEKSKTEDTENTTEPAGEGDASNGKKKKNTKKAEEAPVS